MKDLIKTTVLALALVVSTVTFAQDKKANNIDDSKIGGVQISFALL